MIHKIDQPTNPFLIEGYYQLSDKFFAQYLLS